MKRIGLTGNIGTGKSTIARIFEVLGVPVYHADMRARQLMETGSVIAGVEKLFGSQVLNSSRQVDRKALAALVFKDKQKLEALNNLVHPMVEKDFTTWCEHHNNYPYVLHEAAILYESGFDRFFEASILVVAPLEICIRRVINRDSVARENVLERIENQWPQEKKLLLAQYVVTNDETTLVIPQVLSIHQQILGS